MSFAPTAFRPLTRGGFGGRAASHFRGLQGRVQSPLGQVGTVIYRSPGGFSNIALEGVSRDNVGAPLAGCRVDLCQGNIIKESIVSDAGGNYRFSNPGSGPFFIIAYKPGSPDVAGATVNTLQPVVV